MQIICIIYANAFIASNLHLIHVRYLNKMRYNSLMTHSVKGQCDMCLMPFKMDSSEREHERYCNYCYRDGDFVYKGNDVTEFQKYCYEGMLKRGIWKPKAKFFAWTIKFAPHWKKKRSSI